MPSYPTQFGKRNFSTGGEAYTQAVAKHQRPTSGKKVINTLGVRRRSSKKVVVKQTPAGGRFDERGNSLPLE